MTPHMSQGTGEAMSAVNAPGGDQVWYTTQADTNYAFQLQRGILATSPIVETTVGPFLLNGLANVEQLKGVLLRLGLTAAADAFMAHVASSPNIRIGDFGEVVAGHLLEDAEEVVRPIDKLRYRESPDWPMKLTDVFCVRIDAGSIVSFIFGEAKTGTTTPTTSLGRDAYRQIYKDVENDEPQILFFTLDRLLDLQDNTTYLLLEEAIYRTPPVPRALRLIFIFDEEAWRETVLSGLHDAFESGDIVLVDDFKCYLLTHDRLREVITDSYIEAERLATNAK